jgi:hypothetical protein
MTQSIPCPVCQLDLSVRPCQSRKSGKRSLRCSSVPRTAGTSGVLSLTRAF